MKLKSNEPFWLLKNGLLHTYPSLQNDLETDVLIIGGGITGSLIAYQCQKDGFATTLVDKREIANGSTSATTAMLQYEIDVQLHELIEKIGEDGAVKSYKACSKAIDKLEKIIQKTGSTCGFERKDSVYFAAMKKDVPKLQMEFECRKQYGFPVRWAEAEELQQTYGISATYGGIISKQGASLDAFKFTHDLLHFLSEKGVSIYDRTAVKDVQYHRKHVVATTEEGRIIKAKKIVYCNGFESVEVIPEPFVKLLSTYALVSEPFDTPEELEKILLWNTADPYLYLRTTADHRLLVGGEDEPFTSGVQRDRMIGRKASRLEKKVAKYFPELPFIPDYTWAGTFGETQDGLPYIGARPDFPNAYFVLGFGGNGITFSVIGMKMLSLHLTGKKHPLSTYFAFNR